MSQEVNQVESNNIRNLMMSLRSEPETGFSDQTLSRIETWLADSLIPEAAQEEVKALIIKKDWPALQDAFFQELEFGTGGLRGIVGSGSNRMNAQIVRRVSQGISHYIAKNFPAGERTLVIAYDSRLYSKAFAHESACVLAANGIKTYIFNDYETTPGLSFAVRDLKCAAGFCFTASHNPPQYAGLKVYGADGAQIVHPVDSLILAEVEAIQNAGQVRSTSFDAALQTGLVEFVPLSVTERYFAAVRKLEIFPGRSRTINIAYTPLHGTGAVPAKRVMSEWGFTHFSIVPSQELPDGHFPTAKKPNPEEPAALEKLIAFAAEKNADVGFASDPDSDRLALISREPESLCKLFTDQSHGEYVLLNGNQTGALLLNFLLSQLKIQSRLPANAAVIKTIVTSELHRLICKKYDVDIFDTLTGFKWIAALVREWEETSAPHHYIFGTEESFGYMPGTYVRDKDGIAALAMAAEMTDYLKANAKTPCSALLELYEEFGAWHEDLQTIDLDGHSGKKRIEAIMKKFRTNPPRTIAHEEVLFLEDYSTQQVSELKSDGTLKTVDQKLDLPKSDVLIFRMKNGGQISVRPSGTEPKIKFYFSARSQSSKEESAVGYENAKNQVKLYKSELSALCKEIK